MPVGCSEPSFIKNALSPGTIFLVTPQDHLSSKYFFALQSRLQEFEQRYKWISLPESGILMPGMRGAYHEQTTQTEPFTGIQVQGSLGCG